MIDTETSYSGSLVREAGGNILPQLLQRVARGDRSAVETIVRRYGYMIWTIASSCSDSDEESENLTLEIFRDIWESAPRFDPDRIEEAAFVKRIAACHALRKTSVK